MKKLLILALVVCLLAGGVFGFLLGKDGTIRQTAPAAKRRRRRVPLLRPAAWITMRSMRCTIPTRS